LHENARKCSYFIDPIHFREFLEIFHFSPISNKTYSFPVKHASKFYSVDSSAEDARYALDKSMDSGRPNKRAAVDSVDEDSENRGHRMTLRPRKK
jgi:hypothetical protein